MWRDVLWSPLGRSLAGDSHLMKSKFICMCHTTIYSMINLYGTVLLKGRQRSISSSGSLHLAIGEEVLKRRLTVPCVSLSVFKRPQLTEWTKVSLATNHFDTYVHMLNILRTNSHVIGRVWLYWYCGLLPSWLQLDSLLFFKTNVTKSIQNHTSTRKTVSHLIFFRIFYFNIWVHEPPFIVLVMIRALLYLLQLTKYRDALLINQKVFMKTKLHLPECSAGQFITLSLPVLIH